MTGLSRALRSLAGPVSFASANFVISLSLQQNVDSAAFGLFAFAQVAIATVIAYSTGLFAAPATVKLASLDAEAKREFKGSLFCANVIFCAIAAMVLFLVVSIAGASTFEGLAFASVGVVLWLRWFLRSLSLAETSMRDAALSDVIYGVTVIAGAGLLLTMGLVQVLPMLAVQGAATVLAVLPVRKLLIVLVIHWRGSTLRPFFDAFSMHGRWALASNFAIDLTTNAHAYIITMALGPSAYAPLALATLLFRPLGVILTGLVQFERPRMARAFAKGDMMQLASDVSFIRVAVVATWLCNVLVVCAAAWLIPSMIFREGYHPDALALAIFLTAATVLVRALREPGSSAIQAAGRFRVLALIAVVSAPITLAGVLSVIAIAPHHAALTLFGAIVGEILTLILVQNRYERLGRNIIAENHNST